MANKKSEIKATISNKKTSRVLYQNLNGIWYAFTEIDGHVFCGKIVQSTDKNLKKFLESEEETIQEVA